MERQAILTETKMKLRITVADDSRRVLSALVAILSSEFDVIATATDGRTALEQIQQLQPSVAVLDLDMPELNGIQITREIVRQRIPSEVVICSVETDPEVIEAARDAGALGYVLKTDIHRDLLIAVERAARGETFSAVL
jgi:DNA-binding NarL/FixJ family response regulator